MMKQFLDSLVPGGSVARLFTGENRKPTLILLWTPLILTTWKYFGTKSFYLQHLSSSFVLFDNPAKTAEWYTYGTAFLLFGVLSVLFIRFILREPLSAYGLTMGDWRFSLKALALLAPVMALITYPSASDPQFIAEYPLFKGAGSSLGTFIEHAFAYLFFYIGWEVYFRGFMQFGLRERFGDWYAILIQVGFSCILHIGKPDGEIYSSILGALIWGIVASRSRSLLVPIITHWILGVSLDYYISFLG